jgi:oligopeptidase B
VEFGPNEQWETSLLRLTHQSLTTPPRVIDVDVDGGDITVVKQTPTPNVDLDAYVSERSWATASDGTQVPVDIVRRSDTPLDGSAACVVYGYGAYEISMPPWFSVARLSLLDRGVVWALVHPRGGGELGRQWYIDGRLLAKRNTFTDTLAVCDHLVEVGVAAPDRLAIRGGSAGGLLVGAAVTMRPDRFRAAVAEVPFVDVVTTMSDPSMPLTVTEWDEWGDPRHEPYASYVLSYSPYDNTVAADYPALFVTAGLNDPRVSYHEPAKWVAKLRQVRTNDRPLLLRTEMGSGHAGPSGRYDAWRDEARVLTFLLETL